MLDPCRAGNFSLRRIRDVSHMMNPVPPTINSCSMEIMNIPFKSITFHRRSMALHCESIKTGGRPEMEARPWTSTES